VVAPPSVHPNGGMYRWDVGVHPLESPLAPLPDAWRAKVHGKSQKQSLPADCDARLSFLGAAFEALGWLGVALSNGRRIARCPWHALHSDTRGAGNDSSTVLFAASPGANLGGFHCLHAHCSGRSVLDVVRVLPPVAIDAGARSFPQAYRNLLWHLASHRQRPS
jgi:hypothetical protein